MSRHASGRWLAEKTGWDVVVLFPAVGQERHRGSAALCTHPKLPGWEVIRARRGWQLASTDGTRIRLPSLWQAIEEGNRMIAAGGLGEVAPVEQQKAGGL